MLRAHPRRACQVGVDDGAPAGRSCLGHLRQRGVCYRGTARRVRHVRHVRRGNGVKLALQRAEGPVSWRKPIMHRAFIKQTK